MDEIFGYLGGTLTTIAFIPQAYKVYKTKKTKDLSLAMFVIFSLGVVCWFIYGIMLNSMPMILANFFTICFALYILAVKARNYKEDNSID
ncbi:MAG: SemiSWEET transporter [Arcobacteraceae bacterium]|nr:SemiSWEET transporter [Arcobacteraceae bacterium]